MTTEEYNEFLTKHGEGHGREKNKYKGGDKQRSKREKNDKEMFTLSDWKRKSEWEIAHCIWDVGHGDFVCDSNLLGEMNKE